MSHIEVIEVQSYYPAGISRIIGLGGGSYIGVVNESTVLKYPCIPGDMSDIQIEYQLLQILGTHPHIIRTMGLIDDGILLEYAKGGDLNSYVVSNPSTPDSQRLRWCLEAAEAVEVIHEKRVIHCDINLRNLLLDENLNVKLADFQGVHKSSDGKVLLDGLSRECTKSFQPRASWDHVDVQTDLFALGSAIYFIMTGHEVFPELDSMEDEEEIEQRFRDGKFPVDVHACSEIADKCWRGKFDSAKEVVQDIRCIHEKMNRVNSW